VLKLGASLILALLELLGLVVKRWNETTAEEAGAAKADLAAERAEDARLARADAATDGLHTASPGKPDPYDLDGPAAKSVP